MCTVKKPRCAVAAALILVGISGCGSESDTPLTATVTETVTASPSPVAEDAPTAKSSPDVEPEIDVSFSTSCQDDYPLVFQTDPYRFVAETTIYNDGNVKARVNIETSWLFFGGGRVSSDKWIDIGPGRSKRVPFSKPATQDQVAKMIGWQYGDTMCKTRAFAGWLDSDGRFRMK